MRADALRAMPGRLNGTGARAAEIAAEVKALIDDAQAVIDARHEQEAAELEERIERYGQRGSGKKDIQDRHKREVRRHRTAELRLALATFAGVYRDALIDARHPAEVVDGHPPHRGGGPVARALPERVAAAPGPPRPAPLPRRLTALGPRALR